MRTGRRSQSPRATVNNIDFHARGTGGIMENTIIAREHSFNNKGLKTATNRIIKATEQTAKSLMTIALTMVEIEEKELYKDDFPSIVEYGEKVFGYKKSAVYNMLKVGRQYLLPDTQKSIFAEEDGTDFTFNQLSRLLPLPSVEVATELVESETITPDMTLRQIEDAVKAYNHKDETETEETPDTTEETPDTTEEEPKEFSVAVEHAPNECLVYKYYTAEEILDLLRTANEDGLILHVYRGF